MSSRTRKALRTRPIGALCVGVAIALSGVGATAQATPPARDASATQGAAHHRMPTSYVVTDQEGANPEGMEVTRDGTMYVTSVMTGEVFKGDTRHGVLHSWLPAGSDGRTHANGIHVDRWGRVLIAGGATGHFYVYSASGRLLAERSVPGESFLNDFSMTKDAVFVTDSSNGIVYRASLSRDGIGPLQPFVTAADFSPAQSFLNGIVTTPDGRYLLVVDWDVNRTWRIDVRTREVRQVQVDGDLPLGGDGALISGHIMQTVQADWDAEQMFVRTVRLSGDYSRATVLGDSPRVGLDVNPTTMARDRGRLLWVESQLNSDQQRPPYRVGVVPGS